MSNVKRVFGVTIISICCLAVNLQAQNVSMESLPPVVVKTLPQAGVSNVDPGLSEISVTFSKDMTDSSWSIVQVTKESFPQIKGQPEYLSDQRTCVIKVSLEPDKTYAIWLNTDRYKNFKDTNKKPAIPYLLLFKTKAE